MYRLRNRIQTYKDLHNLSYGKLAGLLNTNAGTIWKFLHGGPTVRSEFATAFEPLVDRDRHKLYIANVAHLLPPLDKVQFVCMDANLIWKAYNGFTRYNINRLAWEVMNESQGIILRDLIRLPHDAEGSDRARYRQYPDGWRKEYEE